MGACRSRSPGSDVFYAFEGVLGYASPDWGPQPLTALDLAGANNCVAMGVAANDGINTMQDLKGKRVGWVVGSPALQSNVRAFLAFGGLTTDDVQLVEEPSYGGAWQAFTNGQIDAMTAVTSGSGLIEQAAASPQGLKWLATAVLRQGRLEARCRRSTRTSRSARRPSASISTRTTRSRCAGVPYPVLITYTADADLVYNVIKAIDLQAPVYSKAQSGTEGWAADSQVYRLGRALQRGGHQVLQGSRHLGRRQAGSTTTISSRAARCCRTPGRRWPA